MKHKPFFLIGIFSILVLFAVGTCYSQDNAKNDPLNMVEHTVAAGDNLHLLAAYYLYNARLWMEIYNVNKENIKNPDILDVGIVLKIPIKDANWKPKFSIEEWRARNLIGAVSMKFNTVN